MELAAVNLIFGKLTRQLMFIQGILVRLLDIIDAQELNVEMEVTDITEFVIKMDVV